jgi:hypothetical protein
VSNKRRPIEYRAQFVPGIFRASEEVEYERDADLTERDDSSTSPVTPLAAHQADRSRSRPREKQKNVRTNERISERSNERTTQTEEEPRRRIRHSFDIWEDQLLALAEIQAQLFLTTRRKPKLGELVQEALDRYIQQHERTNEHPNVRTNERTRAKG